jgi:hypothetical protein
MLVLETYVYLRDTGAKSFYHKSMMESLWAWMTQLTLDQQGLQDESSPWTGDTGGNQTKNTW